MRDDLRLPESRRNRMLTAAVNDLCADRHLSNQGTLVAWRRGYEIFSVCFGLAAYRFFPRRFCESCSRAAKNDKRRDRTTQKKFHNPSAHRLDRKSTSLNSS